MRYIHVNTPGSNPYRRPRQKFPSARKRQAIGSGHHQANSWGAEWYKQQCDNRRVTQVLQLAAGMRNQVTHGT